MEPNQPKEEVNAKAHVKYYMRCLKLMPAAVSQYDPNRMTLVFFALSGLDLLNALPDEAHKASIIDWIYSLQVCRVRCSLAHASKTIPAVEGGPAPGFRAAPELGLPFAPAGLPSSHPLDFSHVTMTYTAILSLAILGDDLSRLHKAEIAAALRDHQLPDGSFASTTQRTECDLRFMYCACSVAHMLGDWRGVDVPAATRYIMQCLTYEGAFGQSPGLEAHGGSTFCALASLSLMGRLGALSPAQHKRLVQWLLFRQQGGFQGRPSKDADTCYSFWIGASLTLLGAAIFVNAEEQLAFLMTTQDKMIGGFAKHPHCNADPLHSYLGLAGLSLQSYPGLAPLHPGTASLVDSCGMAGVEQLADAIESL